MVKIFTFIITGLEVHVNMNDTIFTTAIAAMAEKIQVLEFQLKQAEEENRNLRSQVNDMYIKIHIGKETNE